MSVTLTLGLATDLRRRVEGAARRAIHARDLEDLLGHVRERRPVDVVVLGPAIDDPTPAVVAVRGLDATAGIVILAPDGRLDATVASLRFVTAPGPPPACLPADRTEEAAEGVRRVAEEIRQRRRHRREVAGLNLRLAEELQAQPRAAELFGQLLEHAPIGVVKLDEEGRIRAWNRRAGEMLDAEVLDLLALPVGQLFGEEDRATLQGLLDGGGGADDSFVLERTGADGQRRFLDCRMASAGSGPSDSPSWLLVLQDVTDRVLAERQRDEVERRLRTFVEVGTLFGDVSDSSEALERLARLIVPTFADLCIVDVIEEGVAVNRAAAVTADPGKRAVAGLLAERHGPGSNPRHPSNLVLRTGRPVFVADMTADVIRSIARNEEHRRLIEEFGPRSFMAVPLAARGHVLGAMILVSAGSGRRYGAKDVEFGEELGRRAGLFLENVRLFERQREIARILQQALLPKGEPSLPWLEIAPAYRAFGEGIEVGGDFYDFMEAENGDLWVAIGDVCGKGPEAAAVTGLARHTVRALSISLPGPAEVLAGLNDALLRGAPEGVFCTVAFARLTPLPGGIDVRLSVGGHPLPLRLGPDGRVERFGRPGTLLGIFADAPLSETSGRLEEGESLLLYTDGLVEGLGPDGEERLGEVLSTGAGVTAKELAARIERELVPTAPHDDVAFVVLRVPPSAGDGRARAAGERDGADRSAAPR